MKTESLEHHFSIVFGFSLRIIIISVVLYLNCAVSHLVPYNITVTVTRHLYSKEQKCNCHFLLHPKLSAPLFMYLVCGQAFLSSQCYALGVITPQENIGNEIRRKNQLITIYQILFYKVIMMNLIKLPL